MAEKTKKETGLVIHGHKVGQYEITNVPQMAQMSMVLKAHIVQQNLYTQIQGKNYAHVEGWQFAGGLVGLLPRVVKVEDLSPEGGAEKKWMAEVEIVDKSGAVVSRGFGICSNKEMKRSTNDEYAILSMAQTRAIGKAFRNLLGWVMKLAGYEATPQEEMIRVGTPTGTAPAAAPTKPQAPRKTLYDDLLTQVARIDEPSRLKDIREKVLKAAFTPEQRAQIISLIDAKLKNGAGLFPAKN